MAHNITIAGATYPAVPSIDIPSGSGTASFYATNDANVLAKDISNGKIAYSNNGQITGTMPTYANPTLGVTGYDSSGSTYLLTGEADPAGQFCSSDGQVTIAFPKALMGNATAADVASGKTFTSQNGIAITGTASGGVTNLVTGTFTPSTTGSVGTVTIPYTGTGHPIMCAVFPAAGSYKSTTDIYTLVQQYAVVEWYMSKANTALAPTYETSGGANYGCTAWVYKSSASSATTYSRSSAMTTNTFTTSNPTAAGATCVRFLGNTTLKYYTASTSYGLVSGTEYRYVICYSG